MAMASTDQIVVLASGVALLFGGALLRIAGAATEAAWLGGDMPASLRETCEDALRGSFAVMRVGAAAALLGLCMALSPLLGGAGALLGVIATPAVLLASDLIRARRADLLWAEARRRDWLVLGHWLRGLEAIVVGGDVPAWRRTGLVPVFAPRGLRGDGRGAADGPPRVRLRRRSRRRRDGAADQRRRGCTTMRRSPR